MLPISLICAGATGSTVLLELLNAVTGKERKITANTRYFSPDISHDGSKIAAVAVFPDQQSTVDILDKDGKKYALLPMIVTKYILIPNSPATTNPYLLYSASQQAK